MLQLVCLIRIRNAESVEVPAAPDFEFSDISSFLDLHRPSILAPRGQEKLLDFFDLFRLQVKSQEVEYLEHIETLT